MSSTMGLRRRGGRGWRWPVLVALAVIVVVAAVAIGATRLLAGGTTVAGRYCRQLAVPAYFYSGDIWAQAADSRPVPSDMILDITGVGAGASPVPHFQTLARQARAAGIAILGYSSTVDGQRPAAEIEADSRNYKAWYGATGIFLDRVSGQSGQLSYYQQLASYIHGLYPGPSVWLNPGDYPDQSYMSVGDVVMVFEGTYAQYLSLQVPSWAGSYPASKFAHTIYATPESGLDNALKLATGRHADHVYVTDGSGLNPYAQLPSYWSTEDADATAACGSTG